MNNNPTICLNMIVKNESKIITRLFDSIIPIINCYCICDTGSTDDTILVIENYFKEKNISGKLIQKEFINFEFNRTFSLHECENMADFILLLDADMILKINNFDISLLNHYDCFSILQGTNSFSYQNVRLIRNDKRNHYNGVTHEFLNTPQDFKKYHFSKNELFIEDIGDGGCKQDKYTRDIKLLTQALETDLFNSRYLFYLANSYYCINKYKEAIEFYKKRLIVGGWKEEIFYSYYRIGLCYKELSQFENAIYYWMESYDTNNERLEGIYEILKYYRKTKKYNLFNILFNECREKLSKNINRDSFLFVHNDVYNYKIYYEYSIVAFYINNLNINKEIIIILNNSSDESINRTLLKNMKFYKNILSPINIIDFSEKTSYMFESNNESNNYKTHEFNSSSACLIPYNNQNIENCNHNIKYLLNQIFVNYLIDKKNGNYSEIITNNKLKKIITVNNLLFLDKDFKILDSKIVDYPEITHTYAGIEDLKIFSNSNSNVKNEEILFIGTQGDKNNKIGIVFGNYNFQLNNNKLNEKKIVQHFKNTNCEKNWIFVNYKNELHIIYEWFPLTICKINYSTHINDQDDNNYTIYSTEKKVLPNIFKNVRGSSNGFTWKNEIWFICHIVSYENPRHYYHIICVFDKEMELLNYTYPFKFEGEPIEFCLSITIEKDKIIIPYSTWDKTTKLGIYDRSLIENLFVN